MSNTKKKRSISPEKEAKFFSKLTLFYEYLSKYFLHTSLLCLVATFLFDLTPAPYYAWAKVFFCHRDFTPLISTSVVIWAFGASLLVYFMGRMETQCFGTRFYDVLLVHEGRDGLAWKLLMFLGELFLMGCCGVYDWPITLFAVCMLQLLNIIYILLIIMQETSLSRVVHAISSQTVDVLTQLAEEKKESDRPLNSFQALEEEMRRERKSWLLMKALRGINYYQHEDMDALSDCLSAEVWLPLKARLDAQLLVSWKLVCCMLDGGQDCTAGDARLPLALTEWFQQIVSKSDYPFFVREGILAAVLVHGKDLPTNLILPDLLAHIKDGNHGRAVDWIVQLLRPLTNSEILPENKRLLHQLEAFGEEHGCKQDHVLSAEDKELLEDFLAYLGYDPSSQEDTSETSSYSEEESTIYV